MRLRLVKLEEYLTESVLNIVIFNNKNKTTENLLQKLSHSVIFTKPADSSINRVPDSTTEKQQLTTKFDLNQCPALISQSCGKWIQSLSED